MNGPVQGVATKAASAPVAKLPDGAALADGVLAQIAGARRNLEDAGEVERDGGDQQQQPGDDARVLQLEGPADLAAGGAQQQHQRAQAPCRRG